ncbi:MAG: TonB-dependent receptor plug domain-containing protein [Chitinivibrionales bacterium]|nr:TonB-dependent receptor plug domain-containing protein [Chitinivibrionales bacterium]MBD3355917.1 TonB-dependent receptor plug domain-containing protein [Chitinivibrionales bacterium]
MKYGMVFSGIPAVFAIYIAVLATHTWAAAADSDDLFSLSIEELMEVKVVTASKKEESIDEAPNVMYVVTEEQIHRRGYRTLRDILAAIPGFGSFHRDLDFVGQVRGIAPNGHNKITYMVNGHSINFLSETSILNGPINPDQFERIEIIVGPGSVLYGPETLLATVNMITKSSGSNEVVTTAGTDIYSGTLNMSGNWGDSRYLTGGITYYMRRGWDAWDEANRENLTGTELTGKVYPSFFITASGELDNLSFSAVFLSSDQPELNIEAKRRNSGIEEGEGHRYDYLDNIRATYTKNISDSLTITLDGHYDNKRYIRALTFDSVLERGNPITNFDLSQRIYGIDLETQYRKGKLFFQAGLQFKHKQNRHNYKFQWASIGRERADENIDADTVILFDTLLATDTATSFDTIIILDTLPKRDTLTTINQIVSHNNTNAYGGYFSCEFRISKKLTLTAALRADYDEIIEGRPYYSPRAAVVFKPVGFWTTKAIYNGATRMPDPWMSPLNPIWGIENNPDSKRWTNTNATRPEMLSTIEWQNIIYAGKARLQLNAYHQRLKDFISFYRPFTNVGDFAGMGLEGTVSARLLGWLRVWANGAYTASNFTLTANPLSVTGPPIAGLNDEGEAVAVPVYTLNGGGEIRVCNGLYVNVAGRYFDRQPAFFLPRGSWGYVGPRFYLDAAMAWSPVFAREMTFSLAARNILNNRSPVSAQFRKARYQPRGISADLKIEYQW